MSNNRKIRKKCDRKNNIERGVINSTIKNLPKETGDIFICTKCNNSYVLPTSCDHYQKIKTEKLQAQLQKAESRISNLLEAVKEIEGNAEQCIYSHSKEFMSGSNAGFARQAEVATEAIEKDKHIKKG